MISSFKERRGDEGRHSSGFQVSSFKGGRGTEVIHRQQKKIPNHIRKSHK